MTGVHRDDYCDSIVRERFGRLGMHERSGGIDEFGMDEEALRAVRPLLDLLFDRYFRVDVGVLLFRVEAIILASLFLALLCAAFLPYHSFGLVGDVLISVVLLAALQSSCFVGTFMSCR